jgi:hypothetical protein
MTKLNAFSAARKDWMSESWIKRAEDFPANLQPLASILPHPYNLFATSVPG